MPDTSYRPEAATAGGPGSVRVIEERIVFPMKRVMLPGLLSAIIAAAALSPLSSRP